MRTLHTVATFAFLLSAGAVVAGDSKPAAPSRVKSAEQIRCELFYDLKEGQSACRATRAWITRAGTTETDPAKVREQVTRLTQAKPRAPDRAGRRVKTPEAQIVPVKLSDLYINFDMNSDYISDDAAAQAATLFEAVNGVNGGWSKYRFEVAGHTDAVGSAPFNQSLSVRRAQAVANLLANRGVSRSQLVVKGYGFTHPVEGLDKLDGMNRRVEIRRLN